MAKARPSPGRRPRKVRKDEIVRMRVTKEQKTVVVEAAAREGLDVSVWLRRLALRAAGALPEATQE